MNDNRRILLTPAARHSSRSWTSSKAKIIGKSAPMRRVNNVISKIAKDDSTILVTGETGTGKGLIAQTIHQLSDRKKAPFIQINCGAIPKNLLESELFGHVKGAFTGASASRSGKFERADGGTIFLDEIGDMSLDLQVKILKVLEENCFEPVGGSRTIHVNVRIIAATHRDLETAVSEGTFRKDLYYRLFVIPIDLAPLRQRVSDIPLLLSYFHEELSKKKQKSIAGFTDAAMNYLIQYDWPGNVRELKNLMERFVVLYTDEKITPSHLPRNICTSAGEASLNVPTLDFSEEGICFNTAVSDFEKELILKSLEQANGVKKQAARLLHLKRTTLVEKIKRYQLNHGRAAVSA